MDEWSLQEQQGQGLRKVSAGAPELSQTWRGGIWGAGSKKNKAVCQG